MTEEQIKASSNEELGKIFMQRFQRLQNEFREIQKKLPSGKSFKAHQQAMYDFVVNSQGSTSFQINGYTIIVNRADYGIGFKHIILRHYCVDCDGKLVARDILNIGNIIANDIELPAKKKRRKFIQNKNGKKYSVILKDISNGRLVFNFFTSGTETDG